MGVWTLKLKITPPTVPKVPGGAGLTNRILARFQREASDLIITAIRSHLGQDSLYQLSPGYAERKPKLPQFRRVAGKSSTQPLILGGEGIYDALVVVPYSDGFAVQVDSSKGISPEGFDYAEWFEEITSYLELGLADVEDQLPDLLETIIFDEMQL